MILFFVTLHSCGEDDTPLELNDGTIINDNYYVKYNIKGNGTYGRFSDWIATTPQGTYANNGYQERSWSQIYGPVDKGFKCEVLIDNYISKAPTIEIHVSKNEEPFALKVIETGKSASYTVGF